MTNLAIANTVIGLMAVAMFLIVTGEAIKESNYLVPRMYLIKQYLITDIICLIIISFVIYCDKFCK